MINFVNSFLSYVMLLLVMVIVAGCGLALGLFLRKRKDRSIARDVQESAEE